MRCSTVHEPLIRTHDLPKFVREVHCLWSSLIGPKHFDSTHSRGCRQRKLILAVACGSTDDIYANKPIRPLSAWKRLRHVCQSGGGLGHLSRLIIQRGLRMAIRGSHIGSTAVKTEYPKAVSVDMSFETEGGDEEEEG